MAHPGGRPLKYKTVAELQSAIEAYFDYCDNNIKEIHPKEGEAYGIADPIPYTMSGLAYHLGTDRKTILNYSYKDSYSPLIKRARARVEMMVEERMLRSPGVVAGYIFNLKNNFDWSDRKEIDQTTNLTGSVNVSVINYADSDTSV